MKLTAALSVLTIVDMNKNIIIFYVLASLFVYYIEVVSHSTITINIWDLSCLPLDDNDSVVSWKFQIPSQGVRGIE